MLDFWLKMISRSWREFSPLVVTYQVLSSASVDDLWQKVVDLGDVSWHPLLAKTDVPRGQTPKPGLNYQAVSRLFPMPIQIFVERVLPQELLSVRIFALPGVEERVTYRVESTVCGTCVSYSVTLKGWLSPLVWSVIRPYAAKVASELAQAVERELLTNSASRQKFAKPDGLDFFSLVLWIGFGQALVQAIAPTHLLS
ncbi:MAG TPA: SRPBCC family protein [Coleofasciculaceae cyanobacterium]|jgi:hypothetical protein